MKINIKKKYPAQILLIVLVLMSILSIIALSATLTAVRDTEEKTQNNQYQAYYAVGEQELLDFQQKLGADTLPATVGGGSANFNLDGYSNTIPGTCTSAIVGTNVCQYNVIPVTQYNNSGTGEVLQTTITTIDSNTISNYDAEKDQDMLFELDNKPTAIVVNLEWNHINPLTQGDVAWNFTVDTFDGTNYGSEKAVYNSTTNGPYTSNITTYSGTCFSYNQNSATSITVTIKSGCASSRMFLRIRPIIKAVNGKVRITSLSLTGNSKPLQRKLKSVTTTATTANGGSNNPDNPTAVLETSYLLLSRPFSLFDYVLRTESDVIKD